MTITKKELVEKCFRTISIEAPIIPKHMPMKDRMELEMIHDIRPVTIQKTKRSKTEVGDFVIGNVLKHVSSIVFKGIDIRYKKFDYGEQQILILSEQPRHILNLLILSLS
ncbi:MAG: hypothetical protein DRG78_15335 [Epsilonproteobacteria bacterium]|nr:MAG: hypothetical protein DRG78_15335 [Campylobacterota bacterium]